MRSILLALVTLATGCLSTTTDSTDPTIEAADEYTARTTVMASEPSDDVCLKLPEDDSACASACDTDELATFIPPGSCVTFVCHLTDGSVFRTGGCVPAKDPAARAQ